MRHTTSSAVRRAVIAGAVGCALAVTVSTAAVAVTPGEWYFDAYNIQTAHDAGFTGEGVTIAVIDSQINLDVPTLKGADITTFETDCFDEAGEPIPTVSTDIAADHGTNVVSLIVGSGAGYPGQTGVKGVAPDATILFTATGRSTDAGIVCEPGPDTDSSTIPPTPMADAIYAAIDAGADIISISQAASAGGFNTEALAEALNKGIVVVTGVRNDDSNLFDQVFPRSSNGVIGVQSMDSNGVIQGYNSETAPLFIDPDTDVVGPGVEVLHQGTTVWEEQRLASGTSYATPVVAGFLALVSDKYPEATGNQLIQTLVRNTAVEDHEFTYDEDGLFGYGTASATHMLRIDPTKYDDVNPLIDPDGTSPSPAQIADPPARYGGAPTDTPTDGPTSPTDPGDAGGILPMVLLVVGILLLVLVVTAIIIVVAVRRSRARSGPSAVGPTSTTQGKDPDHGHL